MRRSARWTVTVPVIAALLASAGVSHGHAQDTAPLQLETKISLGHVAGRIDHMAVDLPRHRLFVAELGNNSVGIVDLQGARILHRITGLNEPQGVGHVSSNDLLYVANA